MRDKVLVATFVAPARVDEPPVQLEAPPAPDAPLLARLAAALGKRGLQRPDLTNMPELAPLLRRYDDVHAANDLSALQAAHAALVTEIARASLAKHVVDGAIARITERLREPSDSLGPKRRAALVRRLASLQSEAKRQRSEAERSRLMLAVAALDAEVARFASP